MLKSMRSNIKKLHWILWIVILSFVLWGVGSIGQLGGVPSDVIQAIDGVHIHYRDFEFAYRRIAGFYAQMYGEQWNADMARQLNLRQTALNSVIEEAQKTALAQNAGLRVSEEELRKAIMNIPELQDEDGNFLGREAYLRILRMNQMSAGEFEGNLKKNLLSEKLSDYFQWTIIPSESDLYQKFLFENTKKNFEYYTIKARDLEGMVEYTEEELALFFEENSGNYLIDEKRAIKYIAFDPRTYEEGIVNERDLLYEYYMSHREDFRQEEQVKASHILLPLEGDSPQEREDVFEKALRLKAELEEGADFGLFARMYSEDPGTKEKSGDLGFFGRGQMVPPFEETAFSLNIGEISDPVETQFGVHIIKVTDKKEEKTQPFDEVKHRIDARLKSIRADRLAQRDAESFLQGIEDLQGLMNRAEEKELEIKSIEPFLNKATIPDIGHAPDLAGEIFIASENAVGGPVQVRNTYYVYALSEIVEPHIADLDHEETRKKVIADLKKEKARELAGEKIHQVKEFLNRGLSYEEIKEQMPDIKIDKNNTGNITLTANVQGITERNDIIDLFRVPVGRTYGPVIHADQNQFFVYMTYEEMIPDMEDFESERDRIADDLMASRGFQVYRSWFESVKEDLRVRSNNELIRHILER